MSDPQSIEDVLEGAWPDSACEADALAAAVDEHGTIPDRERGIAVIRLDPEEAEWMHKAIDALALEVPAAVHRDFAPRFHAVARIIGGEP